MGRGARRVYNKEEREQMKRHRVQRESREIEIERERLLIQAVPLVKKNQTAIFKFCIRFYQQ